MDDICQIQLPISAISFIPLNQYESDFIFIVNGKEFRTSRIVADILSPNICKIRQNDPTINEYIINTKEKGDFQIILGLVNFDKNILPSKEIPFIKEAFQILGNDSIIYNGKLFEDDITFENVFIRIKNHEQSVNFYPNEEINFLSEHFYEIGENEEAQLSELQVSTIERILGNPRLQLNSEDQLFSVALRLYKNNRQIECSRLFEYIDFLNVTSSLISEFIEIFDIENMTQETWKKLAKRLSKEIPKEDQSIHKYRVDDK